jgi:acetyl-CoA synthetase
VLKSGLEGSAELERELRATVREVLGPVAVLGDLRFVASLPKTRSGKIMRRILRKVAEANYTDLGDLSTLAEPQVVEQIVQGHKAGR